MRGNRKAIAMKRWIITVLAPLLAVTALIPAVGRQQETEPDMEITPAVRTEVIEGALKQVDEAYVFPEKAKEMIAAVHKREAEGEYASITSAKRLASKLTDDLRAVCKDKHLRILYSYKARPKTENKEPTPEEIAEMKQYARRANHGFEKVERLEGNVGYLDLRGFFPADEAGETVAAAMSFLANTDALIVDLRKNHGGSPVTVALVTSYLFDPSPVHLNDLYFRPQNETRQFWTLPFVPGKRFGMKKPVYVLTSRETFSGGEEFANNLRELKRATLVGETTGGGAHPGGIRRINDHFAIWLPTGRAINPISKSNWEGTGVKPHVDVPAARALKTAYVEALHKVIDATPAADSERRKDLQNVLEKAQKELESLKKT